MGDNERAPLKGDLGPSKGYTKPDWQYFEKAPSMGPYLLCRDLNYGPRF